MLTSIRQKLSVIRTRPSPLASLADFGLWTLRNALPPTGPKFWVVVIAILAAVVAAVALPGIRIWVLTALVMGVGVIGLSLVLSYLRTMMAVHAETQKARLDQLSRMVSQVGGALKQLPQQGPGASGGASLRRSVQHDVFASPFMDALVASHDALAADVSALSARLDAVSELTAEELAELRADLAGLQRRTERQLRLDTGAIAQLTTRLDAQSQAAGRSRKAG